MKKQYYIFGLQRSGTNYLQVLLNRNFDVHQINRQPNTWKHSIDIPKGLDKALPLIHIYKNPYQWVESIAWRNKVDWTQKQDKYPALQEVPGQMIGKHGFNLVNLCKTYRHFMETWTVFDNGKKISVQYESLLDDAKRVSFLEAAMDKLDFNRTSTGEWFNPTKGSVSQSKDFDESRFNYYRSMRPKYLTPENIQTVNDVIGPEIFEKLGYDML